MGEPMTKYEYRHEDARTEDEVMSWKRNTGTDF